MADVNEAFKLIHFKNCHDRLFDGTLINSADLYDTVEMLDGSLPAFTPEKELYILSLENLVIYQIENGDDGSLEKFLNEINDYSKETMIKDQFVLIEFLILASMYQLSNGDKSKAIEIIKEYETVTVSPGVEDIDSIYVRDFLENIDSFKTLIPLFKDRIKNMIDTHYDWILRVIAKR